MEEQSAAAFHLRAGEELLIGGAAYRVAAHPAASGQPYGQEGRQATVYQLTGAGREWALKVFKPRYRLPGLTGQARRLAAYAHLPGLLVCKRIVLAPPTYDALLRRHPNLTYAVLMPWVAGPTWLEVIFDRLPLHPARSLRLARGLARALAEMEQEGLAHCDLSGANVLLPALLAAGENSASPVELVDIEQMYSSDLKRPELLPEGSPGYAQRRTGAPLWSAEADRFAGAMLLAEMLGWCDEAVREHAWGESYFDPAEMQTDSRRFRLLLAALERHWGRQPARNFYNAWTSSGQLDCPTFGDWMIALPRDIITAPPPGAAEPATRPPRAAKVAAAPPKAASIPPVEQAGAPAPNAARGPGARSTGSDHRDAPVARLFAEGSTAFVKGDWPRALQLLNEVEKHSPGYPHRGVRARALIIEAERQLSSDDQAAGQPGMPRAPRPVAGRPIAGWLQALIPAVPLLLLAFILALALLAGALASTRGQAPTPTIEAESSTGDTPVQAMASPWAGSPTETEVLAGRAGEAGGSSSTATPISTYGAGTFAPATPVADTTSEAEPTIEAGGVMGAGTAPTQSPDSMAAIVTPGPPASLAFTVPEANLDVAGRLAYVGTDNSIWTMTPGANDWQELIENPAGDEPPGERVVNLVVSPSGKRMLYTVLDAGSNAQRHYMLDLHTGQVTRHPYSGSWSPDSTHIATSVDGRLIVYNVETGAQEAAGDGAAPNWTADRQLIVFREGNVWLLEHPPDPVGDRKLTDFPVSGPDSWQLYSQPVHHYSGRILFAAAQLKSLDSNANGAVILTVDQAGSVIRLTGPGGGEVRYMELSPAGTRLAYSMQTTRDSCLSYSSVHFVSPTGGAGLKVAIPQDSDRFAFVRGLTWSPDQKLIYAAAERTCATGSPLDVSSHRLFLVDPAAPAEPRYIGDGSFPAFVRVWAIGDKTPAARSAGE